MNVLRVQGLTKSYGKLKALQNLNLNIDSGSVYGILGPNGSGKTTTLAIILNILKQDSGSFEWFGGEYGIHTNKHIGAILETPNFYPYLNAVDNLEIVSRIKEVDKPDINGLLELVNLKERRKSKFRTYSLGMKQRLAIAATLINNPKVVIFDEPTNGLDPEGIADIRNILSAIADSGRTVILASHLLNEVEKICSHVSIIKSGKLLANGPIDGIINNDFTLELGAANNENLLDYLKNESWAKNPVLGKKHIECQIASSDNNLDFNKLIMTAGISLTHLVKKERSLEQNFLEITKNN